MTKFCVDTTAAGDVEATDDDNREFIVYRYADGKVIVGCEDNQVAFTTEQWEAVKAAIVNV